MKHEVAKQAANGMTRREIDKYYFNQHIFFAVVTVSGEEGNIDVFGSVRHMARRLLCSAHLRKGIVFSLSARTGDSGEEREATRAPR